MKLFLLINGPQMHQFSCLFHQSNYLFFRVLDIKFTKVMNFFDLYIHGDTPISVKYFGKQFNLVISLPLFFSLSITFEKTLTIFDMQNLLQVDRLRHTQPATCPVKIFVTFALPCPGRAGQGRAGYLQPAGL